MAEIEDLEAQGIEFHSAEESLEVKYSTSFEREFMCSILVICTPHGMGQPTNLCPDTLTLPIGFLKLTFGACDTKMVRIMRKIFHFCILCTVNEVALIIHKG